MRSSSFALYFFSGFAGFAALSGCTETPSSFPPCIENSPCPDADTLTDGGDASAGEEGHAEAGQTDGNVVDGHAAGANAGADAAGANAGADAAGVP